MSGWSPVMMGPASQAPTWGRNHNCYLLRWDGFEILFDPGEGTQGQSLRTGVACSSDDLICITHLHGDCCPGLPGVLALYGHEIVADGGFAHLYSGAARPPARRDARRARSDQRRQIAGESPAARERPTDVLQAKDATAGTRSGSG